MASFLLFSLLLTVSATVNSVVALPQPPPTHLQDSLQQQQINTVINSIVNSGNFSNWANLLAQADPSLFPLTATFLIPDDAAFLAGNASIPANVVPYHIVPRRFNFSELRRYPTGARLPTLLPGKTLLITNNSVSNFTINGAPLTYPDLFQSSDVSVHEIKRILDYNLFGDDAFSPENSITSPELRQKDFRPMMESPKSAGSMKEAKTAFIVSILVMVILVAVKEKSSALCDSLLFLLCWIVFTYKFYNNL